MNLANERLRELSAVAALPDGSIGAASLCMHDTRNAPVASGAPPLPARRFGGAHSRSGGDRGGRGGADPAPGEHWPVDPNERHPPVLVHPVPLEVDLRQLRREVAIGP